MTGRPVHLKAETLQRTGSFKIRGAVNKIGSLSEAERKAGVVAASAGNHGQAVAWAAREAGDRGDDLHARRDADGEGRADAQLRRARRADRRRPSRTRSPLRSPTSRRPARRSSTRSRITTSSPARGRSAWSSSSSCPSWRRSSSRSAAEASRPGSRSRCGRSGRTCGSSACRRPRAHRSPGARSSATRSPRASRSSIRAS